MTAVENARQHQAAGQDGSAAGTEFGAAGSQLPPRASRLHLPPKVPAGVSVVGATPSKAQFDNAPSQLKGAFGDMETAASKNPNPIAAPTAEDFAARDKLQAEAGRLNDELGKIEAFGRSKVPGRMMRLLGAGMIVLGAVSSLKAFIDKPDWVEGLKTADLGLLAGHEVSGVLVRLGVVGPTSAIGRYAGARFGGARLGALGSTLGKGVARMARGRVLVQGYAVFEAVDALRSAFGIWGSPQDTGAAVLSGMSAVGFAMTAAPASEAAAFEAASWSGPVGWAIVAGVVVGRSVYEGVKDAHKYEAASKICLKAAGFNEVAAAKLCRQAAYLSAVSGTGQMSFLAKWAHYRGMTMVALRDWINKLTPEQVEALSDQVLFALNEGVGDMSRHQQQWVGAGLQDKSPVAKVSPEEAAKRWADIEMSVFEQGLVSDKVLAPDKATPPSYGLSYK
jgi:hypothetical protein